MWSWHCLGMCGCWADPNGFCGGDDDPFKFNAQGGLSSALEG